MTDSPVPEVAVSVLLCFVFVYAHFPSNLNRCHGVRRVVGMFWCAPIIPYGNMLFNLFESNGKPFREKLCNRSGEEKKMKLFKLWLCE